MNLLKGARKMNKEEFIKKLKKRLEVLEDAEIEDIIAEYEGYISEKVAKGLTEEEAVKELGDFEEIVSDLLAAYKVKSTTNSESGFTKVINNISRGIDAFLESLNSKSGRDILKILIEVIIILLIICLLKIPFIILSDLGSNIFAELIPPFGRVFKGLWAFIIEVSYIIVAVIFFIKMFEKRYFSGITDEIIDSDAKKKEEKKGKPKKTSAKEPKEEEVKRVPRHSVIDTLSNICIVFLKIFAILFLFGIVCYLIGITITLGIMIYLLTQGVTYFGVLLLLIALFIGGCFFLEIGINFILNKSFKSMFLFPKIISIIVLTGIALTMSAFEIASTEIIYDHGHAKTTSTIKEIAMQDDLTLYNYDRIIIDNSLKNKVKIEYTYPDIKGMKVDIDLTSCKTGYCLHSYIDRITWNKDILKTFIEDLKSKKIYTNDYRIEKLVYLSEANYDKLMKNLNSERYNEDDYHNFTKTYNILDITDSNDYNYTYITIRSFNNEEVETVKIPRSFAGALVKGNNYEFTFEYSGTTPDDDIKSIFNHSKLINVVYTAKTGLDQTQDKIPE